MDKRVELVAGTLALAAPRPGWELHFAGTGARGTGAEGSSQAAVAVGTARGCSEAEEGRGRSAQNEAPPPERAWPRPRLLSEALGASVA